MKKYFAILLVVGLVLSVSSGVFAKEGRKAILGKLFVFSTGYSEQNLASGAATINTKLNSTGGLGVEYPIKDDAKSSITIGLNIAVAEYELTLTAPGTTLTSTASATWSEIPISYKMKFQKEEGKGGFYAKAGISYVGLSGFTFWATNPQGNRYETEVPSASSIGFNIGGGYEFGKNLFAEIVFTTGKKEVTPKTKVNTIPGLNVSKTLDADLGGVSIAIGKKF